MKKNIRFSLALVIAAVSCHAYASGQRSTVVTSESIRGYPEFVLQENAIPESSLHYIGTIGEERHLLMVTKTAYSKRADGRVGMPWDHVFSYTVSTKEMTVINGWDISDQLNGGGVEVRPSFCPLVSLSATQKTYVLDERPEIKMACLEMRP